MVKWFESEKLMFIVLMFLALIIKIFIINFLSVEVVSDAKSYWNMVISMLETGKMDDGQGNLAFFSAGYPLFLIPFFSLFGKSVEVALYVNVTLGLISTSLVYLCSKVLLRDWRWAFFASLVWCFYPPNAMYTAYLAKENLMIPLLLLQVYLLITFNDSLVKAALLGIVFGVELLVGPAVILTLIPIIYILMNINWRNIKINLRATKNVSIFVLGCGIVLTPWLTYTNTHLGSPVLNTNGNFNLYLGNNENSKVHFISIMDTPMADRWHELKAKEGEIDSFNKLKELAINYIIKHPLDTIRLSVKKFIYFWTPPYHSGKSSNPSTVEKLTRIIWLLYYLLIMLFFLTSFLFLSKMRKEHFTLLSIVFLYCAIHGIAYVIFRYRLPVMPLVIILAISSTQFIYVQYKEKLKSVESVK